MRTSARRIGAILVLVIVLAALLVPAASAAPANWGATGYYGREAWGARGWGSNSYQAAQVAQPCGGCGSGASYYTVQPGDTLASIAAYFGTSYWYLAQLNGLPDVNCIYAGEVLRIGRAAVYGPTNRAYYHNWAQPSYVPSVTYQYPAPSAQSGQYYMQPAPYTAQPAPSEQPGPYYVQPAPYTAQPVPYVAPYNVIGLGPWTATYYTTQNLSGNVFVQQQVGSIDFDLVTGQAPLSGMQSVNWSATFNTTVNLPGSNYVAQVAVDDGAQVFVDGNEIINAWQVQNIHTYTQAFTVAPGSHTITVEYFQQGGEAHLHFAIWPQ